MKKKLLILSVIFIFFNGYTFGQACTPDPQYTNPGVYPDSATGFDTAYVGIPYTQLVTIVVPKDTQAAPPPFPPVNWDSTVLASASGFPASLSYSCWNNSTSPNNCSWMGNTKGCVIITGTPTAGEVGTHPLTFNTNNYLGGSTSPVAYAITYYKIVVMPAGAVQENAGIRSLEQNNPNPFSDFSEIQFMADDAGAVKLRIFDIIGNLAYAQDIQARKGINKITLQAKDFKDGIYFYSVTTGKDTSTRKMIVKK